MPNYNAMISDFQEELAALLEQRGLIERQIANITKAMDAIKTLAEEANEPAMEPPPLPPDEERGFTDQVRAILKANSARSLGAVLMRDILLKDMPERDAKVLLVHTHNTLKRLKKQGEVEEIITSEGRTYRWKFVSANTYADIFDSPEMRERLRAAMARNPRGRTVTPLPGLDELEQAPGLSATPNTRIHKK